MRCATVKAECRIIIRQLGSVVRLVSQVEEMSSAFLLEFMPRNAFVITDFLVCFFARFFALWFAFLCFWRLTSSVATESTG